MKVLWFEVTTPSRYTGQGLVIGGWQDSLERIVRTCSDIELFIAFESQWPQKKKIIDGVTYLHLNVCYTKREKKQAKTTWDVNATKLVPLMKEVVSEVEPDIIQVFGTEWPFGLIAKYTDIPVVVHIQGAMGPYNNALFPPGYNFLNVAKEIGWKHPKQILEAWKNYQFDLSRIALDKQVWEAVPFYMGRTKWDEALSAVMHPGREYFHVEEAIRSQFTSGQFVWKVPKRQHVKLISTGCSNFWKGQDMLLQVAHLLTNLGLEFDWDVAGYMPESLRRMVEQKENYRFEDNHVHFLGYIQPDELAERLCASTMYVHTAYVENSPNSICEAQCMGVPIVSTNVGGISTLVKHEEQGFLVPANDPWQMAYVIMHLASDYDMMIHFSESSKSVAKQRHDDQHILAQLRHVYTTLLNFSHL